MDLCKEEPNKYEWLSMHCKGGRRKKKQKNTFENNNNDSKSLGLLMKQNTNYDLCGVKKSANHTQDSCLLHLKNVDKGHFVCNLKDQNGGTQHCIGAQKTSRSAGLIFDCRETEVLDFSQENLNKCCGQFLKCISMPCIGEIKQKKGKNHAT